MLGAIGAELLGLRLRAVEIDHHRIFIRRVIAVEPHQDRADAILLQLQKFLAPDGGEVNDLCTGGRRGHKHDRSESSAQHGP